MYGIADGLGGGAGEGVGKRGVGRGGGAVDDGGNDGGLQGSARDDGTRMQGTKQLRHGICKQGGVYVVYDRHALRAYQLVA